MDVARLAKGARRAWSDRSAAAKKAWDKRGRKKPEAATADQGRKGPDAATADQGKTAPSGKLQSIRDSFVSRAASAGIRSEKKTPTPPPPHSVDVESDRDGDGITDAARVGVAADEVPPPPKIPRLPNLTGPERDAESAFADAFEKDPDGMARKYIEMVNKSKKPNTYEVDAAKNLFEPWAGKNLSPEARAEMRSTMNTALHQTANAIAKRAFLMHLDGLSPEEKAKGLLVTVGGCGSGKGFALKTLGESMPDLDAKRYGSVWDSAGDQNATENPWLLKEAKKRGIKVTYAYVSANPEESWAHPKRGVVARAHDPEDGRMVDAHVFADSYVIGARNHSTFAKNHANEAKFIYVQNGDVIKRIDSVPDSDLKRNRKKLSRFAVTTVAKMRKTLLPRIYRGALVGQRIWAPS